MSDSAIQLLEELRQRGVELRVSGDRLQFRPGQAVTPELRDRMAACKPELLRLVAGPARPTPRPHFHYAEENMSYGDVCAGWSPAGWARELRRKADCCDAYRADIAHHYRAWAADIERRLRTPTGDNVHGSSAGSH